MNFTSFNEGFRVMRKRYCSDLSFSKKLSQLNKKALAQEDVVNLEAYRSASLPTYNKTILIVDEDPVSLNSMKRLFESARYRVFIARDAMEVSKIIEDTPLDMILLEVQLPWIDGYELCALLKSTPYLKNLPVALISENKTEEDVKRGFESGCDEYFTKPIPANELQCAVEKLMN